MNASIIEINIKNRPPNEIPIPTCRYQPKMIMWVFHQAIEKQNLY